MTISERPNEQTPAPRAAPADVFVGPVTGAVTSFPARHLASAYQTVAWRAPTSARFDGRPANDFLVRAEAVMPAKVCLAQGRPTAPLPAGWFTFAIGAGVAALMGALLGGILSV